MLFKNCSLFAHLSGSATELVALSFILTSVLVICGASPVIEPVTFTTGEHARETVSDMSVVSVVPAMALKQPELEHMSYANPKPPQFSASSSSSSLPNKSLKRRNRKINRQKDRKRWSCLCHRVFRSVCGSNGVNYGNLCMLNCASISLPDLRIKHFGRCSTDSEE